MEVIHDQVGAGMCAQSVSRLLTADNRPNLLRSFGRPTTTRPTSMAAASGWALPAAPPPTPGANSAYASTTRCCSIPARCWHCARGWPGRTTGRPIPFSGRYSRRLGASFIVNGATPAQNSALASAGAELRLANGVSLLGKFDGEFASRSTTYGGTGMFRYRRPACSGVSDRDRLAGREQLRQPTNQLPSKSR